MSTTLIENSVAPHRPGISWGPVLAGAVVATAVTFLLVAIGSGLGFAAVSPTGGSNPSVMTFTVLAAVWLVVVQWISSFFGGYLAGRLRPASGGIHGDEVMFRDTACGFVAWAVATLFIVVLISSGASSVIGGAEHAVTSMASSAAGGVAKSVGSSAGNPSGYLLDTLFRPTAPSQKENSVEAKAEAGRILVTAATSDISRPDHDYLVQIVSAHTGLTAADASKRVDQVIGKEKQAVEKAKQAANVARKAAASLALYTGFSMLIGAFIACVAGAIGGRQRDAY